MRTSDAAPGRGHLGISGLRCAYGSLLAVNEASFEVEAGEHVAILGANGSGKSTLLRSIVALHKPSSGTITIDGQIVSERVSRLRCAWVPQRQTTGSFPLRVSELLESSGDPDAALVMGERLGLSNLLDRPISTLSGGQLQRAFLARGIGSLSKDSVVLIADEPTASLDFDGQAEIADILRSLPTTVVVATHDSAIAAGCDRRFEMAAGMIREVQ